MYIDNNIILYSVIGLLLVTLVGHIFSITHVYKLKNKIKDNDELLIKTMKAVSKPKKKFDEVLEPIDYLINVEVNTKLKLGLIPLYEVSNNAVIRDSAINKIVEEISFKVITFVSEDTKKELSAYIDGDNLIDFITERIFIVILNETTAFNKKALRLKRN